MHECGGPGPEDLLAELPSNEPDDGDGIATPERLEHTRSFGTAIGAAMLGLEQALRSQPPPQVVAAEHRPIRGLSGPDDELALVFPDDRTGEDGPHDEVPDPRT